MAPRLRHIACDGVLYRGSQLKHPEEVWDHVSHRWVTYRHGPFATGARWITEAAAEVLQNDISVADRFSRYGTPPWVQETRSTRRDQLRAPVRRAYKVFEKDGAWFRMPAERQALIIDQVRRDGKWVPYAGDRCAPAMFGNFLHIEEEEEG